MKQQCATTASVPGPAVYALLEMQCCNNTKIV